MSENKSMQPRDPLIWALEWAGILVPPPPAGYKLDQPAQETLIPESRSREEVMEAKIGVLQECIIELREQVDALLWLTSGRVN